MAAPGIFTTNGAVTTWDQPFSGTFSVPYTTSSLASSNCQTFASSELFAPLRPLSQAHPDEPKSSSGVHSAFHTPLFTSPHTQTSQTARLVFFLFSTHHSLLGLPLHTPLVARLTSPQPSSLALHLHTPRRAKKLVWCSFCFPHTPRRSAYLSTHPDEPKRLVWCPFCFPHSQIGQHGLSGIVIARLTSPHNRRRSPYLSTHPDDPKRLICSVGGRTSKKSRHSPARRVIWRGNVARPGESGEGQFLKK